MTEHFTREEAVALVRERMGTTAATLLAEEFIALLNAAVTAKQAEWEAQGAVGEVENTNGNNAVALMDCEGRYLPTGTQLYTHALPAQPAELAKQADVVYPFFHGGVKIARQGHAAGLLNHLAKWMRREEVGDAQTLELVAAYVDALETTPQPSPVAQPAEPVNADLVAVPATDCAGGSPCSFCIHKSVCAKTGCVRQKEA